VGRLGETFELLTGSQRVEPVANRLHRHRLEPQSPNGLRRAELLDDLAEDQLALAPGVAGVHHGVDVVARQQLLDRPDALALPGLAPVLEPLGEDRQGVQRPALVAGIDLLGREELVEVTDGEGDDVVVALEVAVVVGEAAQRTRNVPGDARLLGDDEGFGHRSPSPPGEILCPGAGPILSPAPTTWQIAPVRWVRAEWSGAPGGDSSRAALTVGKYPQGMSETGTGSRFQVKIGRSSGRR
jgi:hypothetical protein